MTLINARRSQFLFSAITDSQVVCGGSVANTTVGLAQIGGRSAYIGKVKKDRFGDLYRQDIHRYGVTFNTAPTDKDTATARSIILVTPDAQRTMNTYLGACVHIGPSDIDEDLVAKSSITCLEGYLFDRKTSQKAFEKTARVARAAGQRIALTLSDSFCVERHRQDFLRFIDDGVDILIGNEKELCTLVGSDNLDEVIDFARTRCQHTALTRTEKGSIVIDRDEVIEIPAVRPTRLVDTTGAGDMYAGAFLFGLSRGLPLSLCGHLGSACATSVLTSHGTRSPVDLMVLAQSVTTAYHDKTTTLNHH